MKNIALPMLFSVALSAASVSAAAQQPPHASLPAGVAQQGTFASEQLQKDVTPSAFGILRADGCADLTGIEPYVRVMPVGAMGARHWVETWVFQCSNGSDEIDISFQETPDGGADYSVSSKSRPTLTKP